MASTGAGLTCPDPAYTRVEPSELFDDPAAFVGQSICVDGTFRRNPRAGGCDPSTAGCCSDDPQLETDAGGILLDLNGPCSSECGDECPFGDGIDLIVWGAAVELGGLPGLEVAGSEP